MVKLTHAAFLGVSITRSLACKINHFVENKSQATNALEDKMKKGKLDKLIPNLQLICKV